MWNRLLLYLDHQKKVFFSPPFTLGNGMFRLTHLYVWVFWKRLRHRYFLGKYFDLDMLFDTKNDGSCIAYHDPLHDFDVLYALQMFKKGRKPLFVDVGANIGSKTLLALKNGYEVISFEPNPEVARILQMNVLLNNFFPHFHFYPHAVSNKKGLSDFFVNTVVVSQSSLSQTASEANYKSSKKIRVPLTTLDDVLPQDRTISVLKIDVEGEELSVLKGAKKLMEKGKILCIHLEITDPHQDRSQQVLAFLKSLQFTLHEYSYQHKKLVSYHSAYNCIAIYEQ